MDMHPHESSHDARETDVSENLDICSKCSYGNVVQHRCIECNIGLCEYCLKPCKACSSEDKSRGTCEDCELKHASNDVHPTAPRPTHTIAPDNWSFVQPAEKFTFPALQDFLTCLKATFKSTDSERHNGHILMLWDNVDTVAEVMGGKAGVSTQLRIKGCLIGPNFDLVEGIDLASNAEQEKLKDYLKRRCPFLVTVRTHVP